MSSTLFSVDTQHTDTIHDAKLDYYSKRLATCSSDRSIKIYDLYQTESHLSATIFAHDAPVFSLDWAHPRFGTVLISASYDGRIIIHTEISPGQWNQLVTYSDLNSAINCVEFCPQEYGLAFACCTTEGVVAVVTFDEENNLWISNKLPTVTKLSVNSISWAPYMPDDVNEEQKMKMRLVTGGCDSVVRVWVFEERDQNQTGNVNGTGDNDASVNEWKVECELREHKDWVNGVCWSKYPNSYNSVIASCDNLGTVLVWKKSLESVSKGGVYKPSLVVRFEGEPVFSVSFNLTGGVLAVSKGEGDKQEVQLYKETFTQGWILIKDEDVSTSGFQQDNQAEAVFGTGNGGDITGGDVPAVSY